MSTVDGRIRLWESGVGLLDVTIFCSNDCEGSRWVEEGRCGNLYLV